MMATGDMGKVMGTMFFPVGIFFLVYALYVYHWRLKLIKKAQGGRFDDPYGPTILTVGVLVSVVAVLIFVWTEEAPVTPAPDTGVWDSEMVGGSTCGQLDRYGCTPRPPAATAVAHTTTAFQKAWAPGCMATLPLRARSADMIFAAVDALNIGVKTVDRSRLVNVSAFRGCLDVSTSGSDAPQVDYELPVRQTFCVRDGGGVATDTPCRMTASIVEATGTITATGLTAAVPTTGPAFSSSNMLLECGSSALAAAGSARYELSKGVATSASDLVTEVSGASGAALQLVNSSYGMRSQIDVTVAGTPAKLSLVVEYGSEVDRSVGQNPTDVMLRLEFASTATLTAHHHASTVMQFLSLVEDEAKAEAGCR